MIRTYNEMYLDDAVECLGAAVEYAVLFCNMDGQEFLDLLDASWVTDEFGRGNVRYISGISGFYRHSLAGAGIVLPVFILTICFRYGIGTGSQCKGDYTSGVGHIVSNHGARSSSLRSTSL